MTYSLVNGKVWTNGKLELKNIVIENGKIKAISESIEGQPIDIKGKLAIPGLIDAHVHLREPGSTHKEDFLSGSKAAAAGGITTILDMPNTNPPTTSLTALEEKRALARKSIVNYGFFMGATQTNLEEIKMAKGIAGVKVYLGSSTGAMALRDDAINKVFECGKKIVVHAENDTIIEENEIKYENKNEPEIHSKIRTDDVEYTSIQKALLISKKIHVTHLSSGKSLELISDEVTCDVTPHHLFLSSEEYAKQGNRVKMNPSLKSKKDVEQLWKGIMEDKISSIATDHAPHTLKEKMQDYWKVPSGVPGLETMLPLLLDAVNKSKITLGKVIELTSLNPSKLFRIKNKGKIEAGYDADITIIDMDHEKIVSEHELFTKCKWSPFNGWNLKGWPVMTIVNGEIIFKDGKITNIKAREVEFL